LAVGEKKQMIHVIAAFILLVSGLYAGTYSQPERTTYQWSNLTRAASFPEGYNYPVFVFGDWMVAMNKGAWLSRNGKKWTKTELPESGLNSAHQKYLQFNGAIYALGSMTGNYERFSIDTTIRRTRDFRVWETVGKNTNLPKRVFYGAAVFQGKMWLFGGFDGRRYCNDVWNSADGIRWERVVENAPWSARMPAVVVAFNNKIWLMGGGVIDGETNANPLSSQEIWISSDGKTWSRETTSSDKKWGGAPVVFDGKLWLVGMNRGSNFASAVWMTQDGETWQEFAAPWSPRGAVAAWVHDGKLLMTGGKSSYTEKGEIKFVYSNDVWSMEKREVR
jgi:hypothetical protein